MLNEQAGKSRALKEMLNWETYRVDVGAYLREHANGTWRSEFVPLIQGAMEASGANWQSQLGVQFDVRSLFAEEWFETYTMAFAQPILDTTERDLSELLQTAQREGWGLAKMRGAIGALFDRYSAGTDLTDAEREWFGDRAPAYRRDMIARTESMRSVNSASDRLLQEWGAPAREWLATRDSRTREAHAAANGQVQPFGQPFHIGGYLMNYPGDASLGAPPSQFISCRCTVAPVLEETE